MDWLVGRMAKATVHVLLVCCVVCGVAAVHVDNTTCPNVLVTYFSESEVQWTRKLAQSVAQGAEEAGATTKLLRINETSCNDLLWADAIALGSPVYWATVAAAAKLWLEQIQTVCFGWPVTTLRNKLGAAFCTGGHPDSGKDATMATILAGFRSMRMVTIGCDEGACNPWGVGATHPDGANTTTLAPEEQAGALNLGSRMVEVASLLASKAPSSQCASLANAASPATASAP